MWIDWDNTIFLPYVEDLDKICRRGLVSSLYFTLFFLWERHPRAQTTKCSAFSAPFFWVLAFQEPPPLPFLSSSLPLTCQVAIRPHIQHTQTTKEPFFSRQIIEFHKTKKSEREKEHFLAKLITNLWRFEKYTLTHTHKCPLSMYTCEPSPIPIKGIVWPKIPPKNSRIHILFQFWGLLKLKVVAESRYFCSLEHQYSSWCLDTYWLSKASIGKCSRLFSCSKGRPALPALPTRPSLFLTILPDTKGIQKENKLRERKCVEFLVYNFFHLLFIMEWNSGSKSIFSRSCFSFYVLTLCCHFCRSSHWLQTF